MADSEQIQTPQSKLIIEDDSEEMTILEGPTPEPVTPKEIDSLTLESITNLKSKRVYPPPYTLETIEAFEKANSMQFPSQLRQYLTEVSSHIYKKDLGLMPILLDSKYIVDLYPVDFFAILYDIYDPATCPQMTESHLIRAYVIRKSDQPKYGHLIVINQNDLMRLDTVMIDYGLGSGSNQYLSESLVEYIEDDNLCYPADRCLPKSIPCESKAKKQSCCSQILRRLMKPLFG